MLRRLFTFLAALSLLLFVAVCVQWVRSYFRADYYLTGDFATRSGTWRLASVRGAVHYERARNVPRDEHAAAGSWRRGMLGFTAGESGPPLAGPGTYVRVAWLSVPYWAVALVAGAVAAGFTRPALRRYRRARRLERGLCPGCGYDLRASTGRCPECGTLPAGKEA